MNEITKENSNDPNEIAKEKFLSKIEKIESEGETLNDAQKRQKKFWEAGGKLPICVNEGCNNLVVVREWKNESIKSECSACIAARKEGKDRDGIKMHKKKYCENSDGHLNFQCPVSIYAWTNEVGEPIFQEGLDLDHKDGNHFHNKPDNVETICKMCHGEKSIREGDTNSKKPSARILD